MASNNLMRGSDRIRAGLWDLTPQLMRSMFFADPPARPLRFDKSGEKHTLRAPVSALSTKGTATRTQLVDVVLPKERLLKRSIPIPPTPKAKHVAAADLDLIRRTPFATDQIYSALSYGADARSQQLTQWVAKRNDIAQFRTMLSSHGFTVRRFLVNDADAPITLVDFTTEIAPKANLWRKLNFVLMTLAVVAALSLWLQPAWQARAETAQVTISIDALRDEALKHRTEIEGLDKIDNERTAFVNTVMRRNRAVDALRQLTIALPDNVWISDYLFTSDQIMLNGETSGSAAELVLQLTQGNFGYVPALAGPVSRTADGQERFGMVFTVEGVSQ